MTYGKAVENRRIRKSPFKWFAVHHDCHSPRPEWDTLARGAEEEGAGEQQQQQFGHQFEAHLKNETKSPEQIATQIMGITSLSYARGRERGERRERGEE